MSKLALGLLVTGIAAMPFVDKGDKTERMALAYAETAMDAPSNQTQMIYVVTSSAGATCHMASALDLKNEVIVTPDRSCAQVHEGLDRVTRWTVGEKGNDALKDASGATIMVVGPSDGFAYEAVSDDGTQISFSLSEV